MTRIAAFSFVLLTGISAFAQEPRKPVKYTPAQIADAQGKLEAAKCRLHRPEPTREDWEFLARNQAKPAEAQPPVDLVGFPNDITDADLERLLPFAKRLPGLKAIMLWNTSKVTARGLKAIAKELPELQGLVLKQFTIADRDLSELTALRRLSWVEITRCSIRDPGLNEIASIPKLASLTLVGNSTLTSVGYGHLQKAEDLRELNADIAGDSLEKAGQISKLVNLTRLHVHPVDDREAALLGKLKQLVSLDLTGLEPLDEPTSGMRFRWRGRAVNFSRITDAGLQEFMGCKALTTLRVSGSSIRLQAVPELAQLEALTELSVSGTSVGDSGLSVVRKLKTLEKLDLSFTSISDEGVRELDALPRLAVLDLSDTRTSDKALESATQMRSLRSLRMDGTRVAATEVRGLSQLTALKHLSLQETNVTAGSFPVLGSARSLQVLDLRDNCPNLTNKDVGPLESSMPKTRVLADYCNYGTGWAGAVGYAFKLPEVKSPSPRVTTPVTNLPRTTVPVPMAPPKVAPPPPTRTGGTSPK